MTGPGRELGAWCREHLGAEVTTVHWTVASSGVVRAVDLDDGRRLVVKVRPGEQAVRIAESRAVQTALADAGFPVPRPVGGLHPFGAGGAVAGAEVRVDGGTAIDARSPGAAATMAGLLRDLVVAATAVAPAHLALHEPWGIALAADRLWPDPPHDPRFDLGLPGAGWIDELGAGFRARLVGGAAGRERLVGHVDWRAEHVLVDAAAAAGTVVAVLDWDSLVRAPEAVIVGQAAAGWTIVWGQPDPHPTTAEAQAFVAAYAYARARGRPFDPAERDLVDAAHGYVVAYGARCEHSDELTGRGPMSTGWRDLLRARAARTDTSPSR